MYSETHGLEDKEEVMEVVLVVVASLVEPEEGEEVCEGVLHRLPQLPGHEAAGAVEEVFCQHGTLAGCGGDEVRPGVPLQPEDLATLRHPPVRGGQQYRDRQQLVRYQQKILLTQQMNTRMPRALHLEKRACCWGPHWFLRVSLALAHCCCTSPSKWAGSIGQGAERRASKSMKWTAEYLQGRERLSITGREKQEPYGSRYSTAKTGASQLQFSPACVPSVQRGALLAVPEVLQLPHGGVGGEQLVPLGLPGLLHAAAPGDGGSQGALGEGLGHCTDPQPSHLRGIPTAVG